MRLSIWKHTASGLIYQD